MTKVNYIYHLKAVFLLFSKDSRLNPTHISLYMAFFQLWNHNRFPDTFFVNREDVMRISKIGSKSTYHKCIKDLDHYKYLVYFPSHNPFKGSQIRMLIFHTVSDEDPPKITDDFLKKTTVPKSGQVPRQVPNQAMDLGVPNQGQAVVPFNKHNKQIENIYKLDQPKNELEVLTFFKKEKWPEIEAKKFYNHYLGIGWKVGGKTKIVNWKATAQNWMLKAKEIAAQAKTKTNSYQLSQNKDNLHTTRNKDYHQPL
ncbi:MAG: hypothetical protein KBT58_09485 [Bizionia sp.]|nr:hypothetical protein [Bizionia sp.]